jgi:hypothetical protein
MSASIFSLGDWNWYIWVAIGLVCLIVVGWFWLTWYDDDFEEGEYSLHPDVSQIANIYYHEEKALRSVLSSMDIEIPVNRETTNTKKRRWFIRWFGGEEAKGEKKIYEGSINFVELKEKLTEYRVEAIAQDLTIEPVSEQNTLLESLLKDEEKQEPEGSKEQLALKQLIDSYGVKKQEERSRLAAKRFENARTSSLIVMSGVFAGENVPVSKVHTEPRLRLEKFTPTGYGVYDELTVGGLEDADIQTIDPQAVPDDIQLIVKMPDREAFTPSGESKLKNGKETFLTIIAHGPEYEFENGSHLFVSYAYAIWSSPMPTWRRMDWGYPGGMIQQGC